jgi:P-type E1-E2 ATPase
VLCGKQGNFINADPEMKPAESTEWAKARNTNIIEDLGRVSYVFSDKTGTLTSNDMRMRAVALQGIPHGSLDFRYQRPPSNKVPFRSHMMVHYIMQRSTSFAQQGQGSINSQTPVIET